MKSTGKNTIETVEKNLTDMFIRLVRIYPCLYITFKVAVSPSVAKIIFEMAEITFKLASVADISLLLAKITFAVSEIIINEDVINS